MRALILAAALALLAACSSVPALPDVPQTVTVVVERYKPLPDWAKQQLPVPVPADGTVGAYLGSHEHRGALLELRNCHARLLALLDADAPVDERECAP